MIGTVEKLRRRLEAINFEAELQNEVILLEGVFHTSEHALGDCAISDHEIIFTERLQPTLQEFHCSSPTSSNSLINSHLSLRTVSELSQNHSQFSVNNPHDQMQLQSTLGMAQPTAASTY